jgi:hypothetical protein
LGVAWLERALRDGAHYLPSYGTKAAVPAQKTSTSAQGASAPASSASATIAKPSAPPLKQSTRVQDGPFQWFGPPRGGRGGFGTRGGGRTHPASASPPRDVASDSRAKRARLNHSPSISRVSADAGTSSKASSTIKSSTQAATEVQDSAHSGIAEASTAASADIHATSAPNNASQDTINTTSATNDPTPADIGPTPAAIAATPPSIDIIINRPGVIVLPFEYPFQPPDEDIAFAKEVHRADLAEIKPNPDGSTPKPHPAIRVGRTIVPAPKREYKPYAGDWKCKSCGYWNPDAIVSGCKGMKGEPGHKQRCNVRKPANPVVQGVDLEHQYRRLGRNKGDWYCGYCRFDRWNPEKASKCSGCKKDRKDVGEGVMSYTPEHWEPPVHINRNAADTRRGFYLNSIGISGKYRKGGL